MKRDQKESMVMVDVPVRVELAEAIEAVMVAVEDESEPAATPVTRPEVDTVATLVSLELQATRVLTSCVAPLARVKVANSCTVRGPVVM